MLNSHTCKILKYKSDSYFPALSHWNPLSASLLPWLQEIISQQITWMDLIIHIFDLAKAFSTRCPPWRNPPHLSWLGRGNHEGTGLCISFWSANRDLVSSLKMLSNLQVIYRIFTDICVWRRFGKSILRLFGSQNVLRKPSAFSFFVF